MGNKLIMNRPDKALELFFIQFSDSEMQHIIMSL